MEAKYLYCNYANLEGFLTTGKLLRFTDIAEYEKRENQLIKDNESERNFDFTSKTFRKLTLDDGEVKDFKKITFTLKTRRCHVLCLSNKKNDPVLFDRFNADACIEINVEKLIKILRGFFKNKIEIIQQDVNYFDTDTGGLGNSTDLVFMKHASFRIEDEHRIALFYRFDERTELIDKEKRNLKIFGADGYIGLSIDEVSLNKIVTGVYKLNQ